jgi:hypothetical protein
MYIKTYDSHDCSLQKLLINHGSLSATRQLRIRARSATGRVARAATY